jgi:signal transduction histidine kinase
MSVIILGIVLVAILRAYYTGLEQEYMRGATNLLPPNIVELLEDETSQATLQGYIENVAFLSQTRVQVTDADNEILVDTGSPEGYSLTLGVLGSDLSDSISEEEISYQPYVIVGRDEPAKRRITWQGLPDPVERVPELPLPGLPDRGERVPELPLSVERVETTRTISEYIFGEFPINLTGFGFNVGGEKAVTELRSSQERRIAIHSPAGLVGYIKFTEGPAYGREIVKSVAIGFLFAGGFSIVLAGAAGWWISRRLSDPLIALTQSTSRMAEGDYKIRTDVERGDELGILARSFNHMALMVEKTVATLRRFVSDAAHEIHTPLTALRTNLELATKEPSKETSHRYIEQALGQVERLEGMTNSLLDLSRLESGESEESLVTVNLSDLLKEESEQYASQAEQRGISFILDLPEMDVEVLGRPTQLRCMAGNLLDNAIKFTPEDGRVQAGITHEGEYAELWVEDTGIGISEEEIPKLFQRFYRARNASAYPGSGLGLAIVKSIVEAHGGFVFADKRDQGIRFSVSLPVVDESRYPLENADQAEEKKAAVQKDGT